MSALGSVSVWLDGLRNGDREAVERVWERYFRQLVGLARNRLRGAPRAAADEEGVALSAFDSFFRRVEAGQFPRLSDREDLWEVLVLITAGKVGDLLEREGRLRRDWRRVVRDGEANDGREEPLLLRLIGREPDPAFAAEVADQCRHLLGALDDDELRAIAVRKLEGYTNEDIAAQLGCAVATVERRLVLIRACWAEELPR